MQSQTPVNWFVGIVSGVQWPFLICAAYVAGRHITKLEQRVLSAEGNIKALIERHMPHIHDALSKILRLLERN